MNRRHSSQSKVRGVYSQTLLPDNVKPQKHYLQGPAEEVVVGGITRISTQAVMKLAGFQSRQQLIESQPSSQQKTYRHRIETGSTKALPKVFEPYDPVPGRVPRHVAVERLRKKYESVDLNALLDSSKIDMDKRGQKCLEVVNYCFDDFSGLADHFGQPNTLIAGKGLKYHKGKWRFKSLAADCIQNNIIRGRWARSGEDFEIHKLYVWLCFEDPTAYFETLLRAFAERDRCLSLLKLNFIVDNMPDEDIPDIPDKVLSRIVTYCRAPSQLRDNLNILVEEVKGDFRRIQNKLMLERMVSEDFEFPLAIEHKQEREIPYTTKIQLGTSGCEQFTYEKPNEADARRWPTFRQAIKEFCFNSLLVHEKMPQLLVKTNVAISQLALKQVFDFSTVNAPFYLEEFTARQENCVINFGYYLRDSWVPSIAEAVVEAFKEEDKGWYNLKEATKTVYEMGKLRKLIKQLRLKIQDALKSFLQKKTREFVEFVLRFHPSRSYVGSPTDVINFFEVRDQPPLFFVDLTSADRKTFAFSLAKGALAQSVRFLLDKLFAQSAIVPDLQPLVLPQFFPSTKLEIYIKTPTLPKKRPIAPDPNNRPRTFIDEDVWVWDLYEWTAAQLALCDASLDEYMKELKQFQHLIDTSKYLEKLRQIEYDHRDVYYISECLEERKNLLRATDEALPEMQHVGMYRVSLLKLKEWLLESIGDNINSLVSLLYRRMREQTSKIHNRLIVIDGTLMKTPNTVEELIQAIHFASSSQLEVQELSHLVRYCVVIYEMLEQQQYRLSREQLNERWNMLININNTRELCKQKAKEFNALRQNFQARLMVEQQEFSDAMRGVKESVAIFLHHTNVNRREEFYKATLAIGKNITSMQEQANILKNRQQLLRMPVEDYNEIFELEQQFRPYQELWRSIYHWRSNHDTWVHSPLDSFELVDPELKVEELLQSAERLTGEFSSCKNNALNKLAEEIRQELLDFRPKLPLLIALKREGLTDRHYRSISDTIGQTYNPDSHFKFEQAIQMGMLNYTEEITQISERAFKQHNIERILEQVHSEVRALSFQLASFENIRGEHQTYIVMNLEQTAKELDRHMLNLQSVQYNPSMKPFLKDINQLAEVVRICSDTVDEWTTFQRQWIYLSPIFDSPELQKQIPQEAKRFKNSDHMWKAVMAHTKSFLKVMDCCMEDGTYQRLREGNKNLDAVKRQLTAYLQLKREGFARFYFLSDFELLELLSKARKIETAESYLKRVFENVEAIGVERDAICSVEGRFREKLHLILPVRLYKVETENWFKELEEKIKLTVRAEIFKAFESYTQQSRIDWMLTHPAQAVLAARQIIWTAEVEKDLENLSSLEITQREQLERLTAKVRTPLADGQRATLNCLVVIEVHNLDIVDSLKRILQNVQFEWQKHLRYYSDKEDIYVDCMLTHFPYGYEYLGSVSRLVATPLTDRCYITLMGALKLGIGGAAYGPPGTGKTETIKDLAKILAKQCVILNCSATMDHLSIGKFLRGLAGSGAWTCLDEFNRINPEVLSVFAQQLSSYFAARARKDLLIEIDGQSVFLDSSFSVFVTMNPGIAGRAELPQNLKALFRSVAMMVPDLWMIAEIILYSHGFGSCRELAKKIVATFKLASEQLSVQQHYDYGMRAIKSVLSLVGRLRMESKSSDEAIVLAALRNSTIPKLVRSDVSLFESILKDIFGEANALPIETQEVTKEIQRTCEENNLILTQELKAKMFQLISTTKIRHGIMLVGEAATGKTELLKIVAKVVEAALTVIYPKAVSIEELFGSYNDLTRQWNDGIVNITVRQCLRSLKLSWLIMDGPIDPLWVENFNSVLDDSKKLCLNSGQTLLFTDKLLLLFEVDNLQYASPATVSRCGMVYMEATTLPLGSVFERCMRMLPLVLKTYGAEALLRQMLPDLIELVEIQQMMPLVRMKKVVLLENCIKMFEGFCVDYRESQFRTVTQKEVKEFVAHCKQLLMFCATWTIGSLMLETAIPRLTAVASKYLKLSGSQTVFDVYLDTDNWYGWRSWSVLAESPSSAVSPHRPYHKIQISSSYSIRTNYLLSRFISQELPCMNAGSAGVGKSQTVLQSLSKLNRNFLNCFFNFTAWTSSSFVLTMVEAKLEKKNKKRFVPPNGRKLVITIDDVDMPRTEEYGAQPPIELLRQLLNEHGWYRNQTFANIDNTVLVCNLTVSERVPLSHRFLRKFVMVGISDFSEKELVAIFSGVVGQFYTAVEPSLKVLLESIVRSSVRTYKQLKAVMVPTPRTLHYSFTSRDLYRLYEGVCLVKPDDLDSEDKIVKLYVHQMRRTFEDRLSNASYIATFNRLLVAGLEREHIPFGESSLNALFHTFSAGRTTVDYKEVLFFETLVRNIENYQDEYNYTYKSTLRLVYFKEACQHIVRIARVLSMHRGHIILSGLGGSGRESLAKMAVFICAQLHASITSSANYTFRQWRTDLKDYLLNCGIEQRATTLILLESQLTMEPQLEDLNTLLTSIDLPVLYSEKDLDDMCEACRTDCIRQGLETTRLNIYGRFVERLKGLFHMVLLMSPQHKEYALRIRSFPSLTAACVFDWFHGWPEEALFRVARAQLIDLATEYAVDDIDQLAELVKRQFLVMSAMNRQYERQFGERYFITPNSFLAFLEQIKNTVGYQQKHYQLLYNRFFKGLTQIERTESSVDEMRMQLKSMQPKLIITQDETNRIVTVLTRDNEQARKMQASLEKEQLDHTVSMANARQMQAKLERMIIQADERLKLAWEKAELIKPIHISEIKALPNPSEVIRLVLTGVVILLHTGQMIMDKQIAEKAEQNYFETAKKYVLNKDANSLSRMLINYDKESTKPAVMAKLEQKVLHHPRWNQKEAMNANKAIYYFYLWIDAIVNYHRIMKETQPIREGLVRVKQQIIDTEKRIVEISETLGKLLQKIAVIQKNYDDKKALLDSLEVQINRCSQKLERASKLVEGLKEEKVRWTVEVERLSKDMEALIGDSVVLAGFISFCGFYNSEWRGRIINDWRSHMALPHQKKKIWEVFLSADGFVSWKLAGLPPNDNGLENATIMQLSLKRCLFIDPQNQAVSFIRNLARNEKIQLEIVKALDPQLMRILEKAVQFGTWVIISSVGRQLDQSLEPYLNPCFVQQNSQQLLVVWEKAFFYHSKFQLYLCSDELTEFSPETCNGTTILNFSITPDQLHQQMLSLIVGLEAPSLEEKKAEVHKRIALDERHLQRLSDDILDSMSKQEVDQLLSSDAMINKLQQSRKVYAEIMKRYIESQKVGREIEGARNTYTNDAKEAAEMFFVVSRLRSISPMYQVSLEWYTRIFTNNGKNGFRSYLWDRVALFLEERHRLLGAMLFAEKFLATNKQEWRCLYETVVEEAKDNPTDYIPKLVWQQVYSRMAKLQQIDSFHGLYNYLKDNPALFRKFYKGQTADLPSPYDLLSSFQRILLINCLRPELTINLMRKWIGEELGEEFIKPVLPSISSISDEIDYKTPALLIAGAGTNIYADFVAFAKANNMIKRIQTISLGQGQSSRAEAVISTAVQKGNWVLMENCHLNLSWMPKLVSIMEVMEDHYSKDFKLFLTSMPCSELPSYLVRNCVKLNAFEPLELQTGMTRIYSSLTRKDLNLEDVPSVDQPLAEATRRYRKTLYALAMLHCVIQQRKKYIPLGWNVPYAFTLNDFLVSQQELKIMYQTGKESSDVLRFLISEINYGGRVTDLSDFRLLRTLTETCMNDKCAELNFKFMGSELDNPNCTTVQDYLTYIYQSLPAVADPRLLGLHPNVSLVADRNHVADTLQSISSIYHSQRIDAKEEDQLKATMSYIEKQLPKVARHDHVVPSYADSFQALLLQEIQRYNTLLGAIREGLKLYQEGAEGRTLMTEQLTDIGRSISEGRVPQAWRNCCYYSSKDLSGWFANLVDRLRFLNDWISNEAPAVFWMGGLFLPQNLLAVLIQNHARKYHLPVDSIQLQIKVMTKEDQRKGKLEHRPIDGNYVDGIYLQGCSFDRQKNLLVDPKYGELAIKLPVLHFMPYCEQPKATKQPECQIPPEEPTLRVYKCPLYKVADVHLAPEPIKNSNFIMNLDLPTEHSARHWILAGASAYLNP